jgi:hypothetical protein
MKYMVFHLGKEQAAIPVPLIFAFQTPIRNEKPHQVFEFLKG